LRSVSREGILGRIHASKPSWLVYRGAGASDTWARLRHGFGQILCGSCTALPQGRQGPKILASP
jgi:hypothetical protein